MYDNYVKSINDDDLTYINMWRTLLNRPNRQKERDYTQLVTKLGKYITKNNIVESKPFINAYQPIFTIYKKVFNKYGRDFIELSRYYTNDRRNYTYNYVLRQMTNNMIHITKHTLCYDFIRNVSIYLRKGESNNPPNKNNHIQDVMVSSGFIKYCQRTLPKQLVKAVCKITEGTNDPDEKESVEKLLQKSIDVLAINKFKKLDEKYLTKLKTDIVPSFVIYANTYIGEMNNIATKQIKSLILQKRTMDILEILAQKDIVENNSK
jgi:hypothetical protein